MIKAMSERYRVLWEFMMGDLVSGGEGNVPLMK